jgi:hypothetical protein
MDKISRLVGRETTVHYLVSTLSVEFISMVPVVGGICGAFANYNNTHHAGAHALLRIQQQAMKGKPVH